MSEEILKIYDKAANDPEFVQNVWDCDKYSVKQECAPQEKHIIASVYHGWCLAKYGVNWREKLGV